MVGIFGLNQMILAPMKGDMFELYFFLQVLKFLYFIIAHIISKKSDFKKTSFLSLIFYAPQLSELKWKECFS